MGGRPGGSQGGNWEGAALEKRGEAAVAWVFVFQDSSVNQTAEHKWIRRLC